MLLVIIQVREHDSVSKCTVQFLLTVQVFVKLCEKHVVVTGPHMFQFALCSSYQRYKISNR